MHPDLHPGGRFPDLRLPDSGEDVRSLSELAGGDPVLLHTYRGWFCPKERAWFRSLVALQDELDAAYVRMVSVSVEPAPVQAAFRAGLDARWTFLSDPDRTALELLGLRETTDTVHDPYAPFAFVLHPDLRIEAMWDGYWSLGRPSTHELRMALRAVAAASRSDWSAPLP